MVDLQSLAGGVPATRQISAGGLATGGGTLAADRTVTVTAAVQSDQETATSNAVAVTPGTQQFHPSAAKAWVNFQQQGTQAIKASYNVTSITDDGVGETIVTWNVDFSGADYAIAAMGKRLSTDSAHACMVSIKRNVAPVAGSAEIEGADHTGTSIDLDRILVVAFGDQ